MWLKVMLLAAALQVMSFGQSASTASVQRGQKQFAQTCGFCHGASATGGEGPNLIRSALVRHDVGGDLIAKVIREGRPAKGMPAIPLSEKQIEDVVAYIHWRVEQSDRRSPARPKDYSLKLLMTGNADAGKRFFEGAGQCSHCHSTSGDLAHVAKKYEPADLQARFLYPPDITDTATVTTPAGEQITGPVAFEDQFTIAVRDKDGWYHSWPKAKVKFEVHDPLAAHLELLHKYTQADVHDLFAFLETLK